MEIRGSLVKKLACFTTAVAFATTLGCSTYRPRTFAYPSQGQTLEQTINDEAYCEAWAKRKTGTSPESKIIEKGGAGAVIGTLLGLIIGAAVGKPLKGAAIGAGSGAAAGGLSGAKESQDALNRAYKACMKARGYIVE